MKRQNILYKSLYLIVAIMMIGCSEDYLEEPAPTQSVSEDVIFNSREGVEAFFAGVYRLSRRQFTSYDSGGIYSMYMARSVKGNDLINTTSWFSFDYDNDNREPTYRRTVFSWEYPYFMINQLNSLINGVNASAELSEEDKTELIAEARVLRAFNYFQLAMEFQHTYSYDPSLPAPPIYTELSLEGKPMITLQELYDFILEDLENSVDELGADRINKSYVNRSVAYGILARVYQVMENWSGAEMAAAEAYGGDASAVLDASSYANGFDDISNTEWLWGLPQTSDQSNYYYGAPSAFTDHYGQAYSSVYVNPNFVDEFSATDVRNTFENAYGIAPGDYREYVTNKFTFAFDSDIVLMRTAEMILIEAEALYQQGREDEAHDLLFALQSNRDAEAVRSDNTGSDLFEEILLERRKELYAEIGVEWFDAKRLRRGIDRDPIHRTVLTLEPDDNRFFLKIPQTEIDANDAIDDSVNSDR
ncbi:SusD family protein [Zunongwangia mangrovi]|uniref:SusD family protein n=2 Tax=Zunongwangia mangrovi TaxID=1334022 RepID=A0A1I1CZT4_9FLAO|nr:SusD family protein [Zunongwangia mangrovi]